MSGDDAGSQPGHFTRDLARWSETLAAIARTGLGFTESLYERERFEEVLAIAADIKAAADEALGQPPGSAQAYIEEWLQSVGVGVPGYVTPKVAVGAVVGNDRNELLLVLRPESEVWLYPTGWADVGYSPAEVAVKEVAEETGVICEPRSLLSVIDGQRMGFSRFGMYMLLFHCEAVGGDLAAHPLECLAVDWFAEGQLPERTAGASWWADLAFAAIRGERETTTAFDDVRPSVWRR